MYLYQVSNPDLLPSLLLELIDPLVFIYEANLTLAIVLLVVLPMPHDILIYVLGHGEAYHEGQGHDQVGHSVSILELRH